MRTVERILHVVTRAEIPAETIAKRVRCQFTFAAGRKQTVDIAAVTRAEGLTIIGFESVCERLQSGLLRGLSGAQAIKILRLNSTIPIGHFCIVERDGQEHLAVRSTQILETMDVEELKAHCRAVAQLADQWEERLGRDEF